MRTPPLVGRELDLAVALEQLKRIEAGAPSSLLIRGEAGIGKSRLVGELVQRAGQLDHTVLVGRADDMDAGIPYALFLDLLARLGDVSGAPGGLGDQVDAFRAAVESRAATPVEDDAHVAAVFTAAVGLFRTIALARPTVLVLEDLHVADRDARMLVGPLTRLADVPMLIVTTLRPGGAEGDLEQLLERQAHDGRGAVIDLDPLDRSDTQALLNATLGAVSDDPLVDAVYAASGGNPFFLHEVVSSFVDGGAITIEAGRAHLLADAKLDRLPPRTALLRRLFVGTSADVEVAKTMAVFGRFPLHHLDLAGRLTGQAPHEVARSFDRLVDAGLLSASADGGYEFVHSIVRSTLYDDIGPAERRRLHAAIAADLAEQRRAGAAVDLLELATHVAASAQPGDDQAADVLIAAAGAVAAHAPLVAASHLRRAAEVLSPEAPRRGEALALESRSLHIGSRLADAAAVGAEALAVLPDGSARRATVAIVVNDLYLVGRAHEALAVVDGELAAGGDDCPLRAQAVNLLFQAGRVADADARFADAYTATTNPAAPASAQLMAISHLAQYANHTGHIAEADALLDRLAAVTSDGSTTFRLAVHALAAFADWRPGLVARMTAHLDAVTRLRPGQATLSIGGTSESARIRLLWMQGAWDDALELAWPTVFDLEQRQCFPAAHLIRCTLAEIAVDRGDIDDAVAALDPIVPSILSIERNLVLVRARLEVAQGDHASASPRLEAEVHAADRGGSLWKLAEVLSLLAQIAVETGGGAEQWCDRLDALADRTGWLECRLPALRARGLVERSVELARRADEVARAEGWVVEEAHAALLRGELDDDPGQHLTRAYRLYDGFGAAPGRRRAAAGLRTRNLTVPRRAAVADSVLTETEQQMVRLVREGLSNRQIAAAMHYSVKTVEVYLSRVYTKTRCASRLELIRALDTGRVALDGD